MTPCRTLSRHDPDNGTFGDCHRCCVAAILDLAPEEVPHFTQSRARYGLGPGSRSFASGSAAYGFGYVRFAYLGSETLERCSRSRRKTVPAFR
jgi:hypothetical protein